MAGLAVPASASTSAADAPARIETATALLDPAPTCVTFSERSDFWGRYTDVWNLCPFTVRVKVVIAFGFDSPCHELPSNGRFTHSYGHAGRFDGLVNC